MKNILAFAILFTCSLSLAVDVNLPSGNNIISYSTLSDIPYMPDNIVLQNNSDFIMYNINLYEEGKDWSSPQNIVNSIIEEKGLYRSNFYNDYDFNKAKAHSVYQHVYDNIYGEPYKSRYDCFDVWKMYNVYGHGYCESQSRLLISLMRLAGFVGRDKNIFGPDHTMAEFIVNGEWNLFDLSGNMWYPKSDNISLSSWQHLKDNNSLFFRQHPLGWWWRGFGYAGLANWMLPNNLGYTNGENATYARIDSSQTLSLRSGEKLKYIEDGDDVFVENVNFYGEPRTPHSAIEITTKLPRLPNKWNLEKSGAYRKYNHNSQNSPIGFIAANNNLSLNANSNGSYTLDIVCSYPIVKSKLTISYEITGNATLNIKTEKAEYPYSAPSLFCSKNVPGLYIETLDLSNVIETYYSQFATYSYRIIFEGITTSGTLKINNIVVNTSAQIATNSIPKVQKEKDWILNSEGQGSLDLNFSSNLNIPYIAERPIISNQKNFSPEEEIRLSWFLLNGNPIEEDNTEYYFHRFIPDKIFWDFEISTDREFRWLFLPIMLEREIKATDNFIIVPNDKIPLDTKMYWRVRLFNQDSKTYSPWSIPAWFIMEN